MTGALEAVRCPLCAADDAARMFEHGGFTIVRCGECSLVYVNPRLTAEALEAMYNANEISPQDYYERHISQDLAHFGKRLDIIERFKNTGSLLDLGTNIGTMLKVAKDRGWEVRGVEFNRKAAQFGSEHFGVPIEQRDFMVAKFPPKSFDVVTMNDFLEHVTDPVSVLRETHMMLKDDGILAMTMPNIDTFMARVFKSRWLHLKPNEHLVQFSPKTITAILEKTGFEVLHIQSIGHLRTLETILKKGESYSSLARHVARIVPGFMKKNISLYINPGDEMAVVARKV